jgi:hypothetical protein
VKKDTQIGARFGSTEVLFDLKLGGTLTIAGKQFPLPARVETGKYE